MDVLDVEKAKRQARAAVAEIRKLAAETTDKVKKLDQRLPPQVLTDEKNKLIEEAQAKARTYLLDCGIQSDIAAAQASEAAVTRAALIARAPFTGTGGTEELTARLLWTSEARDMTLDELRQHFDAALNAASPQFAIASTMFTQMARRAERSQAGTYAETTATGDTARELAHAMTRRLDSIPLPGFDSAQANLAELTHLESYLTEAQKSIASGEDRSVREQKITELRQRGASNQEINDALFPKPAA